MLNVARLKKSHSDFLIRHDRAISDAAQEAAGAGVAHVKASPGFTPRTGNLQKSTTHKIVKVGGKVARVALRNSAPYAAPIDKGARPHIIRPKRAKMLRFVTASGQVVFARFVRHPGNKPYRFLHNATMAAGAKFEQLATARMQSIAKTF